MVRNLKIPFILTFLIFLLIFSAKNVNADFRERVLGANTANLSIPATVEGPGFILPDSPLFFLDEIKQSVRVLTAVSPIAKARVYSDIAGERMAELRFMLSKNNADGIKTDLDGVSYNLKKASEELKKARLMGRDVTKVSKDINRTIKEKQQAFDILESQAGGETKARVAVVQEALLTAKVEVEDGLSKDELENEVKDDLRRLTLRNFKEVSSYSKELEADLSELNLEASEAAQKSLRQREEALRIAIAQKNGELKRVNQELLDAEKKKQASYLIASGEARDAIRKAQEAAVKFEKTTQVLNEKIEPTPTP